MEADAIPDTPDRSGGVYDPEDQANDVLKKSASMRMPVFEGGTDPKEKLEAYEEFMVLTAYVEAELVAEKLRCIDQLNEANDQWDGVSTDSDFRGVQVNMAQRDRERKEEDPVLWKHRRYLSQRIESLKEEINRMERQARVCSRVHTFLVGA